MSKTHHERLLRILLQLYRTMGWSSGMCFSNGKKIGAILDRNGLRPSRYIQTEDGMILLSEMACDESQTVVKDGD